MVKKLFMLFSIGMTGYTFYMVRLRPGKMFKNPVANIGAQEKQAPTKKASSSTSRSSVDRDNMRISISRGSGDVSIDRKGRILNAEEGLELKYKDKVITGKNSVAVIKFAGNSIIKLFSNSEFHIKRIQHQDRSDTGTQFNIFHLQKGAIMVDFINRGKMHFLEVTSQASKLQITGTQFLLVHNPKKERSQLAVLEGIVKAKSVGMDTSRFVSESKGVLIKANRVIKAPTSQGWVEKIKWPKLAKGSGIDLYDPSAPQYEIEEWKKRRLALQKMPVQMQVSKNAEKAGKTKAGGMIKNVMGKVFDVAKKGANGLKQASPVGQMNEAAQNMQNLEQAQKDRMNALDSLE